MVETQPYLGNLYQACFRTSVMLIFIKIITCLHESEI